jgi:hypothetical protein
MDLRVGTASSAARCSRTRPWALPALLPALLVCLGGCGSSAKIGAVTRATPIPLAHDASHACASTALEALGHVAVRVYREGLSSERTRAAQRLIAGSRALREAVAHADPVATRAAAQALVASGHLTNLRVVRGARTLADVGAPAALAPLSGTLHDAHGNALATFLASVWADDGYLAETQGLTEGRVALRARGSSIAGSFALGPGEPPPLGALVVGGVAYRYTSFPAAAFPAGTLRVYVLRSLRSLAPLCGRTPQDTTVDAISRIARLVYDGEAGHRAQIQVQRVQRDPALLRAVSRSDPAATRRAVVALLNQHIVRLRVLAGSGTRAQRVSPGSVGGRLLSDVGGPFVLAPVRAPLRLRGRTIGNFVLSIQDDLGYLLLARRLAGMQVLMRRGGAAIMSSLRPAPTAVPTRGPFGYQGRSYRAFTFRAEAFPSGPLQITVLIPIPYR